MGLACDVADSESDEEAWATTDCTAIVLEREGRAVWEQPLHGVSGNGTQVRAAVRWVVDERLSDMIRAFAVVVGDQAKHACTSIGASASASGWALYAATEKSEVVSLCPSDTGFLEPRFVLSSSPPELVVDKSGDDPLGVLLDRQGRLWLMERTADGHHTEIRAWSSDGPFVGAWQLPSDRRWATGLCELPGGRGLVVAAVQTTSGPIARPEAWQLMLEGSDVCTDCSDVPKLHLAM